MVLSENFNIDDLKLNTVSKFDPRTKNIIKYYNIECSFDIETTSTIVNGEKFAFMYEWTFAMHDNKHIYYNRNWETFITLCEKLQNQLQLNENKRLIIYVHNLSYEFQFMRKYFNWLNVFAVDDRKSIKAVCDYGIEFRDSYILSGYSLAKLAENLTNHSIKKLVGDLDYSLIRTEKTKLSKQELDYCNNDCEIIIYYINEQILQYGDITKIPLTNTGRVRQFVKNNCLHYNTNHRKESNKGKIKRYRELMNECILDTNTYLLLKSCFMGGFTHASMNYVNKLLTNVYSIDFTSSYPYVMLSEKFPCSKPLKIKPSKNEFWELVKNENKGLFFNCKIVNLHAKNTYESYLSESKCNIKNGIINNGRIFQADEIITTITDIDLKIIKACYTYDKIYIDDCYMFEMEYLPKQIILSILELYNKKTTLKGVEGKEVEYLINKGMLNSVYGMSVTDIVRGEILYNNDSWDKQPVTTEILEKQIDKYNQSKTRFLYYPWGVWVTAYARKNLWTGILNIGDDYIYSDTDSIKFLNYDNHINFINEYNKQVKYKLKLMCDFRKIDFNLCKPKTKKGIEKLIGVWDFEGKYDYFKTLGAKRYIYYQNNELHITIAGLPKQNGANYMLDKCNGNILEVFKMFNDDLYIPSYATGKNTHTYIDNEMIATITDYQGNITEIKSLSSIHLSECDFTLSISKQYNEFLQMLKNGFLYTGEKLI